MRVLRETEVFRYVPHRISLRRMFAHLYEWMRTSYRGEYLYKNEVVHQLFTTHHHPSEATVLFERPIDRWSSRVDAVIVNSTTTAYEIKTDRDKIDRLGKQTGSSLSVFDRVAVVCPESWSDKVFKVVDPRVGVLVLGDSCEITEVRAAASNAGAVDPAAIFQLLRRTEYIAALHREYGTLPSMDSFNEYEVCLGLFRSLGPQRAHGILLEALRRRFISNSDADDLKGIPFELAHLYYKSNRRERATLFTPSVLGRSTG